MSATGQGKGGGGKGSGGAKNAFYRTPL